MASSSRASAKRSKQEDSEMALEKMRAFQLHEEGTEKKGWVGMSLFGVCGIGPTRQASWDALRAAISMVADARVAREKRVS